MLKINYLGGEINNQVVQTEGRKFQGLVVQGDTLRNLYTSICDVSGQIKKGDFEEAKAILGELKQSLSGRLEIYKGVLKEKGLDTPWNEK